VIVADMLRSALSWEQEHGASQQNGEAVSAHALTNIHVTDKLSIQNAAGGGGKKHENDDQKNKPHNDFREP
jgi:hypothetical protein